MDKQDIAPALLGRIRADFLRLLRNAAPSAATYPAALDYADLVGGALAEAFRLHLSADTLPDGRMYWNIADRVLRPLLEEDHALVADAAAAVQQQLNEAAGLRLLAQRVPVDEDRIDGILNKVCAAEHYEDVAYMLDEPVRTFSRMAVDDTLKANVQFRAGPVCIPASCGAPPGAAANGAAGLPEATTIPMCLPTSTAAMSAAAARSSMTRAMAAGRMCGIRSGRRISKPFRLAKNLRSLHLSLKSTFRKRPLCRTSSRNICGRLLRESVPSHTMLVTIWSAMQTK